MVFTLLLSLPRARESFSSRGRGFSARSPGWAFRLAYSYGAYRRFQLFQEKVNMRMLTISLDKLKKLAKKPVPESSQEEQAGTHFFWQFNDFFIDCFD